jgi:hypothetical protein
MTNELELEIRTFNERREQLLKEGHEHKWVLGIGKELNLFRSREEALVAGYQRVGGDSAFLVKEVLAGEEPPVIINTFFMKDE